MAKNIIKYLLIFVVVFLCIHFFQKQETSQMIFSNYHFTLAKAVTTQQKIAGLSNVSHLDENRGMIFIFDRDDYYPFWMKDTLIPLDIIYLDSNFKVVDIFHAPTETDTPDLNLTIYRNSQKAKYVVELNFNTTTKIGLTVGDIVWIK